MALNDPNIRKGLPTWTARQVIYAVMVMLAVAAGFLLIIHFRNDVILLFTGIAISISIAPAVNWLQQRKVSRSLSVILIFLVLLLLFLTIVLLIIPQTLQQISTLVPALEKYYENFHAQLGNSPYLFFRQLAGNFPSTIPSILNTSSPGAQTGSPVSLNGTLNIALTILDDLFTLSVVLLAGFYWTLEGERVTYGFILFLPAENREGAKEIIQEIETRVGGFMAGQGLLALAIGAAATVAYLIIGLPSVLSLGFLAGVFELVPLFGPILGAVPAIIVTLSTDPSKLFWVVGSTIVIQLLENHILAPRVMQKTVGVNPIVTILAIVSFGSLFGFVGVLLAIPLAAVFQVLIDRLVLHPQQPHLEEPIGRDRISKLSYDAQEFVQDVRKLVRSKEVGMVDAESDELEDTIESIAIDLTNLLDQEAKMEVSK